MNTEDFDSLFGTSEAFASLFASRAPQKDKAVQSASEAVKLRKLRLAFADLVFSWPPNGGADADLYNVVAGLQEQGHDVHLFVLHEEHSSDRGLINPQTLPFPATRFDVAPRDLSPEYVSACFREAIDAWQPDLVFITHGFALKPFVIQALAHHCTIARYYAHELACARDPFRFKGGRPCPNDYLRTPDACRRCALEGQKRAIQCGRRPTWTAGYLAAHAYEPDYYGHVLSALDSLDAVIVSNTALKGELEGFHDNIYIIPGGVHADAIQSQPPPPKNDNERKIILMTGRVEDPSKGLDTLIEAGQRLAKRRSDFQIWATHFDHHLSKGWFKAIGWRDHAAALALYAQADICVVPSLWEEPFGLVAVEAMAAARPVCASRIGGLCEIVCASETGFLFTPGSSTELAKALDVLLSDPALRVRMGKKGRQVVEWTYDWQVIIAEHYLPLLQRLAP